jgi:outer membrane receptor for ferrienterochelin and colicin
MGSNPRQTFKRKFIASSIAAVMFGATHAAVVQAEEAAEEVIVTGIRASLENAMEIKKEAVGVVEAISAEDIGKMPDSNLAESLQRISGVSISRTNGEGSKVTVRGIDAALNMVT